MTDSIFKATAEYGADEKLTKIRVTPVDGGNSLAHPLMLFEITAAAEVLYGPQNSSPDAPLYVHMFLMADPCRHEGPSPSWRHTKMLLHPLTLFFSDNVIIFFL